MAWGGGRLLSSVRHVLLPWILLEASKLSLRVLCRIEFLRCAGHWLLGDVLLVEGLLVGTRVLLELPLLRSIPATAFWIELHIHTLSGRLCLVELRVEEFSLRCWLLCRRWALLHTWL